jgi:rhamnosyltransferase
MHEYRVCAVIVAYNPGAALVENIAALFPQVARLVIVDNGSGDESKAYIDEACRAHGCEVIWNGRNLGIAAALNAGIRFAQSQGCDWVALFDQDSKVMGDFVAPMLRAYEEYPRPEKIAIIAPRYIDRASLMPMLPMVSRRGETLASMTSGSLIPMRAFRECGLFDESLFIDYVDHEFCLRVRSMGFVIIEAEKGVLLHSLGAITVHRFLGKNIVTTNHRAARRYYITRNRIWLYRKYLWKDFAWTRIDALGMLEEVVKILLVERGRASKLRNIFLGTLDAFRGAMGNRVPL